jgi:hypothetical protein
MFAGRAAPAVLGEFFPAAAIAAVLIDNAIPVTVG